MKSFAGRRILITGSAQGIGLEMALRFAAERAEIVLVDRNETALAEAEEMVRVLGVPVRSFALDVTDPAAIASLRERLHAEAGPVEVLINNAGVVFGGPFLDVPLERHLATYRVNVEGVIAMTHAFLPDLIAAAEGHLVQIASASALVGLPYGSTYASSKWAVLGFAESIRLELEELGHHHVGVSSICPSYIGTGMFEGARPPGPTRMLTPEFIAERVLQAVRNRESIVLEPWLVKITPPLKGLLPQKLWDRVASTLGATSSMEHWHGHESPEPSDAEKR